MERAKQFSQLLLKAMEHPKCSYWTLVRILLLVQVCFILSFKYLLVNIESTCNVTSDLTLHCVNSKVPSSHKRNFSKQHPGAFLAE